MRIVVPGEQRTDAWFAARCGRITASNMHCVMAKAKEKKDGTESTAASSEATTRMNYRVRCAIEQVTRIADREEAFKSPEMKRGEEREPAARMHYEIATGIELGMVQFIYLEDLMIGCSPDGLVGDDGLIEVKCGNLATHLSYMLRNTAPPEYKWQIQGSLWVTGRSFCDFVSYHPDFPEELRLTMIRVKRDEQMIKDLQAGCLKFLADVAVTKQLIERLMADRRGIQEAA